MDNLILVIGGVRSGKSSFAVNLAKKSKKKPVFIATCKPLDKEMVTRVKKHQSSRPKSWKTVEEDINLSSVIKKLKVDNVAIIDCLTLWICNLLMANLSKKKIDAKIKEFIDALKATEATIIIVSNEIGWGIVPENKLSREFRDIIGLLHQRVAKVSSQVHLMVAGLSLPVKRSK